MKKVLALLAGLSAFAAVGCGVVQSNTNSAEVSNSNVRSRKTIVVNRYTNMMTVYHGDGTPVSGFIGLPVTTGKGFSTPAGDYRVEYKEVCPPWVSSRGLGSYGPCQPGNPLGRRWIQWNGSYYGIHGNNNEAQFESDGSQRYLSLGCIRMRNADVERLYDFVRVGDRVIVE